MWLSKAFIGGSVYICPGMGVESLTEPNRGVSDEISIFKVKNFPGEDFSETFAYFTSHIMRTTQERSEMHCKCGHLDKDHVVHNDFAGIEHDSREYCSCFRPCFMCRCLGFEMEDHEKTRASDVSDQAVSP